jgi:ankyrin repeat protein
MTKKHPKRLPRPGVDEYGRTPLHYAASDGDAAGVAALLKAGYDPNLQDDDGRTPLHSGAQANAPAVVELLLQAGAEVDVADAWGNTPLFRAVFESRGEGAVIRLLREAGADPYHKNNSGVSPLSLARLIANFDVAQFFADLPGEPTKAP